MKPPQFISDAERAQLDPNKRLNPQQKALLLANMAHALQRALDDPRLQPLNSSLDLRPTGWTLTVDVPGPGHDDVALHAQ